MANDIETRVEALKRSEDLPTHVAIIMDGNGRWAKKRRLPRLAGHRAGREPVRTCVRTCAKIGISYLTLYTFSIENWARPGAEVSGLMHFLDDTLRGEYLELNDNGVQLRVMGRTDMLPKRTRGVLQETMDKLSGNDRLVLTLALSYGGRAEIVDASRRIAADAVAGRVEPSALDEKSFRNYLYDPSVPDPDLLVRTSGELRVSNFMLWQIAYSEIYVTDVLWPDFGEAELVGAIESYQKRDRRYGLSD